MMGFSGGYMLKHATRGYILGKLHIRKHSYQANETSMCMTTQAFIHPSTSHIHWKHLYVGKKVS